MIFNKY